VLRDRQSTIVVALLIGVGVLALSRGAITSDVIVLLAVLVPSIILHEVSHGAVAYLFGDPTAKEAGRLTLNPVAHIDPFGTVILPAILLLSSHGAFGFAKPVPVNPRRMRSPRNHGLIVSLAGPATNIVIALLAAVAAVTFISPEQRFLALHNFRTAWPAEAIVGLGYLNVILAVFNLIPVPPLDGSAVVERLLPARMWPGYLRIRQYSMPVVFVIVFLVPGVLGHLFDPAIRLWENLVL
jgi:Zn-dependent protease